MQVGLIGSGNMARGLARGWGRPVLASDVLTDRAQAWIKAIRAQYQSRPLGKDDEKAAARVVEVGSFKVM